MQFIIRPLLLLLILQCSSTLSYAQHFLNTVVSIKAKNMPLDSVLKTISRQGKFYFSYNSDLIKGDALITISANKKPVHKVLDLLFGKAFEYTETKTHIIIQPPASAYWYATGYVKDELTGAGIPQASVYEKTQFVSTLTNELGYFRLRLKDQNKNAVLSVSKKWYLDTATIIKPNTQQEVRINIKPKNFELDTFVVTTHTGIERSWISKIFLSSKQRVQGLNLSKFFADKPYQTSLLPGIGTHGRMSSQSVNKFSFNLLGGYTGGVDGTELAGVFNINKTVVHGAQGAGIFNMTDGKLKGLQVAGAFNYVKQASEGWQLAGLSNIVCSSFSGVQVAGAYNHTWGNMEGLQTGGFANYANGYTKGVQIAGAINYADSTLEGVQVAGLLNIARQSTAGGQIAGGINYTNDSTVGFQIAGYANITRHTLSGTQVASLLNYAKEVKGVQIGIINIADTSSGVSIGLFNFIKKGYHKLSISTNEVTNIHVAGKFGNKNIYTIISFGINAGKQLAMTGGYGIGREFQLTKHLSLNPELTANQLYLGDFNFMNGIFRLDLAVNYKINKYLSAYISPSFAYCYIDQTKMPSGYRTDLPYNGLYSVQHTNHWSSWVGWNVGVTIF